MEFSAKQIAQFVQGVIEGDEDATVNTFANIEDGKPGAISFLSNPKNTHYIYDNRGESYMFISVLFWSMLGSIVGLGGYVLYTDKRDRKKEKDDLY